MTGQVAEITFSNGHPLATIRPPSSQNRVKVALDDVPLPVRHAVLAAEDRTFYSNPGFSISGIARAMWDQLTGGAGGGSTITQQYIKITTGQDQPTLWRKYKEIIAAAKITQQRSKDQILADYLNTIYLGRGAYGIETAAQAYFGVHARDLTLSQGAMLAGLIQAPSRLDPAKDPTGAKARWNYVLDGMIAQHWLSPARRFELSFPETLAPTSLGIGVPGNHLGHIDGQVRAELGRIGISERALHQDGLRITTTIDQRLQEQAAAISQQALEGQPPNLRAALVAIDPHTGAVLAYYGGNNGVGMDYAQTLKQPGSTFKPFVLAAALTHDPPIGLGTTYDGSSPQIIAGQEVHNSEDTSCADCDLKTAMTRSINTVFYRLAVQLGPAAVAHAAYQAGIPRDLLSEPTAGIALGNEEVRPIDLASAYATFAADGAHYTPHLITRVETAEGELLYDGDTLPGQRRFPPQVARNITEAMLDVADASGLELPDNRPVAAKTGTVEHHTPGQNNDAWSVGYTPTLSTAVWVGTDDNSPIRTSSGRPIYGRMLPGHIWQSFMTTALRDQPIQQFGPFDPIGRAPDHVDDSRQARDHNRTSGRAPHHSPGPPDILNDDVACRLLLCGDQATPDPATQDNSPRDQDDDRDEDA